MRWMHRMRVAHTNPSRESINSSLEIHFHRQQGRTGSPIPETSHLSQKNNFDEGKKEALKTRAEGGNV